MTKQRLTLSIEEYIKAIVKNRNVLKAIRDMNK